MKANTTWMIVKISLVIFSLVVLVFDATIIFGGPYLKSRDALPPVLKPLYEGQMMYVTILTAGYFAYPWLARLITGLITIKDEMW